MNVSRLSFRKLLCLNILWFSLNAQYAALVPVVVPIQILLFVTSGQVGSVEQATLLGWLTAIASTLSLLVPPLIGHLSDQTPGPLGRRRPYILIGGLLQTGSALFLASAETILLFLIGLSILHIGNTVLTAAYQSLIPDQVPPCKRMGDTTPGWHWLSGKERCDRKNPARWDGTSLWQYQGQRQPVLFSLCQE